MAVSDGVGTGVPTGGGGAVDVSIIFVNWNAEHYLREAIASVYEFTSGLTFEMIVVDNASPAGGVDAIGEEFPEVQIIKSRQNLGFAKANNLGFGHSRGVAVLFLNPDTRLVSPAINVMLQELKALPEAGVLGCKLLNTDLSVQTSCIQKFPTLLNQVLDAEALQRRWPGCPLWDIRPLLEAESGPVRVEVISGACMMLRRPVFERVGLFSEDYFMYAEDLDLCFKTKHAGLGNYLVGRATVVHHGGGSSRQSSANEWSTTMKQKAIQHFCAKTRGRVYASAYRATMACVAAVRLALIGVMSFAGILRCDKERLRFASQKWNAVFKWAVGLYDPPLPTAAL